MDEEIIKLLRYINSDYKTKITRKGLIKKGFNVRIVDATQRMGFIEILPFVIKHRDGTREDVGECQLTEKGLTEIKDAKREVEKVSMKEKGNKTKLKILGIVLSKYVFIPFLVAIISGSLLLYYGDLFKKSSTLDIIITGTGAKPIVDELGSDRYIPVLKHWMNDSISVYLTANGGTPIYVENIEFFMEPMYWAIPIEPQQFKIESRETKEIPLHFYIDYACWSHSKVAKDPKEYGLVNVAVRISVHYRNKNEVFDIKTSKSFPLNLRDWKPSDVPKPDFC